MMLPIVFFVVVHFQLQEETSGFSSEGVVMSGWSFPRRRHPLPSPNAVLPCRRGSGRSHDLDLHTFHLFKHRHVVMLIWIYNLVASSERCKMVSEI